MTSTLFRVLGSVGSRSFFGTLQRPEPDATPNGGLEVQQHSLKPGDGPSSAS